MEPCSEQQPRQPARRARHRALSSEEQRYLCWALEADSTGDCGRVYRAERARVYCGDAVAEARHERPAITDPELVNSPGFGRGRVVGFHLSSQQQATEDQAATNPMV